MRCLSLALAFSVLAAAAFTGLKAPYELSSPTPARPTVVHSRRR